MQFCHWLEQTRFIVWISNSVVMSTLVELTHYFSLFLLVGSIVIVDLRLMRHSGAAPQPHATGRHSLPVHVGGPGAEFSFRVPAFRGTAQTFWVNWVFHIKLEVILAAVIFGIIVQWNVPRWDRPSGIPIGAKLLALVSLVLWIGSILAAVEVPALTSVG